MKGLVGDNPEGYTVSRPNMGANTSVLAQTSLAKRPCAREAGGLLTPRVTPSLHFFGGNWRGGCTLSCCVVPIEDEADAELGTPTPLTLTPTWALTTILPLPLLQPR